MELQDMVRGLRLGSDVAEQDSQLTKYFVKSASFYNVIDDEADVVLGPKGSGKSAISRMLVDSNASLGPAVADVDIIPAFNLQGSSIFRRLSTEINQADEGTMRTAWTAYILALIGNHIVDSHWNGYVSDLLDRLNELGLRYDSDRPKTVWSSVVNTIRRIKPSKVEASLTIAALGSGSASAEFAPNVSADSQPVDWEAPLALELDALESLGRRCWLIFDRLDEAFPHNRELERVALRALLHTHRDICSYGAALKTKLFLRTDLLDRITEGTGFVNATHLRIHNIVWDRESIIDFVARRLLGSAEVSVALQVDESMLSNHASRLEVFHMLVPTDLGGQLDSPGWLVSYTSDASRQPNPRNILTLLREARTRQMQICQREHSMYAEVGSILSKTAVRSGLHGLSRLRCADTLYAEFEYLREWLDAMKGRPFSYTPLQFANTMGFSDPAEVSSAIDGLKYAGVFSQAPSGKLTVPILYRYGLNLQDRGNSSEGGRRTKQPQRPSREVRTRRRTRHDSADMN